MQFKLLLNTAAALTLQLLTKGDRQLVWQLNNDIPGVVAKNYSLSKRD